MNEREELSMVVDKFAEAMKKRLLSKLKRGYREWQVPDDYDIPNKLLRSVAEAVVKGNEKSFIDTANLAMFIWYGKLYRAKV